MVILHQIVTILLYLPAVPLDTVALVAVWTLYFGSQNPDYKNNNSSRNKME